MSLFILFFSLFCFFAPLQGYSEKSKFISLYVLCFYKWRGHINIVQDPLPTYNFKTYSTKTYPKITILKILIYKIQLEITDFIISGCILYTKISRIVIFGLVFKLYSLTRFTNQNVFIDFFPDFVEEKSLISRKSKK